MHVLIIKNYKSKVVVFLLLLGLWGSMTFISNFFRTGNTFLSISVDDYLTFSYPLNLKVQKIYANENFKTGAVKATTLLSHPQNNKFNSINALSDTLSFSFPSAFTLNEQVVSGGEILYHVDFNNTSKDINGFVQVWNLATPLKEFLEQSKCTSMQSYNNFSMNEVTINGVNGYRWSYHSHGEKQSYNAEEVFLQKGGKMYRVSYFTPLKLWDKEQEKLFLNIVNSIKIKE